jgi:hypothetical protein
MRQILTGVVGCLALALSVFGSAGQAAAQVTDCDGAGQHVVDTAAEATAVATTGYVNTACDLIIRINLTPPNTPPATLTLNAKSILIESAVPDDPAQRIQVVNNVANSAIHMTAVNNITLNGASVKAHKNLRFTTNTNTGAFTSTQSDIITATDFSNPQNGGVITFNIGGPIHISSTNLHGGDSIEMESRTSSITLLCGGESIPCKDPNLPPIPQVVLDQCTVGGVPPIIFPCNLSLPDAAALRSVCIGDIAVECNGGNKEKRFTAFTFIDITGSRIISDEHVTFTCKQQDLRGAGAILEAEQIAIRCQGKVDLRGAQLASDTSILVTSGPNCPRAPGTFGAGDPGATEPCLDAHGTSDPATTTRMTGKPLTLTSNNGNTQVDVCQGIYTVPGSGFPKLNNDSTPPYPASVLATDGQCGGAGTAPVFQN